MSTADFTSPIIPAVYTPQTAVTLQEFEAWRHSSSFPKHAKISYIQGHLYVEPSTRQPAVEVPNSGMTLNQFRDWVYSDDFPKRGRITFIDGRLFIDMSPERIDAHNQVKSALNRVIDVLVQEMNLGRYYPDGAWITNEAAGVSNEPDAMFASWETLRTGRLAPRTRQATDEDCIELTGSPDWVCEVISNSSEKVDKKDLVESYQKAGIQEYWLIDARGDAIDFQMLIWTPTRYVAAQPSDNWLASPVFGRQFKVVRERDQLGNWRYELLQRAS